MKSITKDIELYKPYRFIIRENIIEIGLESNSTPIAYYFTQEAIDNSLKDKVIIGLKELCKEKNILYREI